MEHLSHSILAFPCWRCPEYVHVCGSDADEPPFEDATGKPSVIFVNFDLCVQCENWNGSPIEPFSLWRRVHLLQVERHQTNWHRDRSELHFQTIHHRGLHQAG